MSDTALCTPEMVIDRVEEDITESMARVIPAHIDDASDLARHYGNPEWSASTVPPVVQRIVAAAVARFVSGGGGLNTSRAGDETLIWQEDETPGAISFYETEIERIRLAATPARLGGFGTISMTSGRTRDHVYEGTPYGLNPHWRGWSHSHQLGGFYREAL